MRLSTLLATLALLLVLLQLVHATKLVTSRTTVPRGWLPLRHASPSAPVRFTIGLRAATVDDMAATFWSITDPDSPHYLELLSREEIEERFGASHEDRQLVLEWLTANGVAESELKHVSSAIEVTTTVGVAERLFETEMRLFQHGETGKQVVRAWGKAVLPDHVALAVDMVTGLSAFPIPRSSPIIRPRYSSTTAAAADPEAVVPQTLRALYQIRSQQSGSGKTTQGVIEFEGEYFNNTDTLAFAAAVGYNRGNATVQTITDAHVVGFNDPSQPGIESTLDVQMVAATNVEAVNWFWIESGSAWMYEWGLHVLNSTVVPQVVSISYGWWEGMQCWIDAPECELLDIDSNTYTASANALFMKIGMAGTSILVSSGDSGANSRTDESCAATNLRPEFPASSPYVTSVGATMVVNASYGFTDVPACKQGVFSCIAGGREVAVSRSVAGFTSGGGFSNTTGATRPSYQDAAVQAYLSSGVQLPPSSYYNAQGRGEPDVAAVGSEGFISVGGQYGTVGGTSMSSPIFAGVASLLNEVAFAKTGKSLGFLNPLLYKMAAAAPDTFHDIVEGDNICPEEFCEPSCKGFVATKGWDPVTGLGTPNAARMEAYVGQLLDEVLARRAERTTTTTATTTTSTPSSTTRSKQRGASLSSFRSPFPLASSTSTSASTAKRQRVIDAFGVQPDETWQAVIPLAIAVLNNSVAVVAGQGTSVLQVSLQPYTQLGNYTFESALTLGSMAASNSLVYVLLSDQLYGGVYLRGVDLSTGTVASSVSLKYLANLLDVSADGKTALTSAGGSAVVLYDTSSGARQAYIANQTWAAVGGGAFSAGRSELWVLWQDVNGSTNVDVVSAPNGITRASITTPPPSQTQETLIAGVSIDKVGQYAYLFWVQLQVVNESLVESFQIQQLDAASLTQVNLWTVPDTLPPNTAPVAGQRAGEVYYTSANLVVQVSQSGGFVTFPLGDYPFLSQPTDVAVGYEGAVYVATNEPWAVVELNSTGQFTTQYPTVNEFATCQLVPFLNVAAGYQGDVYMPLCNSTVLIFGRDGDVTAVPTGSGSVPRGIAAGPRGTLFFTDDTNQQQVTQIDRTGTVVNTFKATNITAYLFSVKYDYMADAIYVTDLTNGLVLRWPVNATTSAPPTTVVDVSKALSQNAAFEAYSLAIDHTHSQLIVTAESFTAGVGVLLWFDMAGNLLPGRNFTYPLPFVTGVAVSRDGSRVYATDAFENAVYVFYQDSGANEVELPIVAAAQPVGRVASE